MKELFPAAAPLPAIRTYIDLPFPSFLAFGPGDPGPLFSVPSMVHQRGRVYVPLCHAPELLAGFAPAYGYEDGKEGLVSIRWFLQDGTC